MTAYTLHAKLVAAGFILTVEAGELLVHPEPPPELDGPLRLLHTGVRALLTEKLWYGSPSAGGIGRAWVGELDPAALIPERVGLLAVAGDADRQWDRIRAFWLIDRPEFFEPEKDGAEKWRRKRANRAA